MRKNTSVLKFDQVVNAADTFNGRSKGKRFYPMTNHRGHTLTEIGLYDSETKKYWLCDVRSPRADVHIKEMEAAIANAK